MAPKIPEISYHKLAASLPMPFHPARSPAQADLYAIDWEGREAVLKDFSNRPWFIRRYWGRVIIAREYRALRRLYGIPGIPRVLAIVGPNAILIERLRATRIPRKRQAAPPPEYFERAAALLQELHDRGIGHGDLRRKNILIDKEAKPYLVDFATCMTSRPGPVGILSRILFRGYAVVDRFQFAQIKADFYPDLLSDSERRVLESPPWYLRFGRFFKRRIFRYRKKRHRTKLVKKLLKD